MSKPKLLLAACCGPCATVAIERLKPDYDIIVLFWGDNLNNRKEYARRLVALRTVNGALNDGKVMMAGKYNKKNFLKNITGLENEPEGGKRCEECFTLRLKDAAKMAAACKFDFFATTLTTSPHKDAGLINKIGEDLSKQYGVKYLPTDFKENNGFARSVELSKQLGIYRQNYCGCGISS